MCLLVAKRKVYFFILTLFFCITSYSNTFHVPFLFDDARNIQHPELRINEFTKDSIVNALVGGELGERPVSNLSFGLNYFFHGYELPGYHAVNIAFHILAGFFLYLLLRRTLNRAEVYSTLGGHKWVAELSALLWLVHPLATQSVTYIVQRMSVMAAFFYILSVYLYVVGRDQQGNNHNFDTRSLTTSGLFLLSAIAGTLAIGSKENAATLPVFIFLYEWFFFQDLNWKWLKKKIPWLIGLIFIFGAFVYIYLNGHPVRYVLNGCSSRDFTMGERLLTQPRVVWHYISLLLYPSPDRLVFDYNFPVSTAWLAPFTTIVSFVGICVILASACILAKRERLLAFCVFWFFGNLAIESSFVCLEMVFEHRTYLPSMFFVLFCVLLVYRLFRNNIVSSTILILSVVLFSYWTNERNEIWQDPVTFWQDSVVKQPGKARSHNNLGVALLAQNKLIQAKEQFDLAAAIDATYPAAVHNLGWVAFKEYDLERAKGYFQEAVSILPQYVDAICNLAAVYKRQGSVTLAEEQLREAIRLAPGYSLVNENLGVLLLENGKASEAIPFLKNALVKKTQSTQLLNQLGNAYLATSQIEDAKKTYIKSLELDKEQAIVHYNLARIYGVTNESGKIQRHYEEAVRLAPYFIAAQYNLANMLFSQNDFVNAATGYQQVISNIPLVSNSLNNMGMILMKEGKLNEASVYFKAAVRVMPENKMAVANLEKLKSEGEW